MSGKRKPVLHPRSVEDDSLVEEDAEGHVVAVLVSPYDTSASSPDSVASGPTYAPRQPGFTSHAHQQESLRGAGHDDEAGSRKNKRNSDSRELKLKKIFDTAVVVKHKPKREPLPMKLRALPQSFWQQPNQPTNVSPGAVYPVLPPLSVTRDPQGDTCQRETPEETAHEPLLLSAANTELLFSLFKQVEPEQGRPPVIRRGRPRKAPSTLMARVLRDDDPCLGSAAGHAALPLLMPATNSSRSPQQVMTMLPLRDSTSLTLPSLSGVDQSYSQILSDLVIRL